MRHPAQRHRLAHLLAAVALAVFVLALSPAVAGAYKSYQHGGIDDCETCHENAHTRRTPLISVCFTCHTDYQIVRGDESCWTCHAPGQDMSWARADASCLSACHLRGLPGTYDVPFKHAVHAGGSASCASCHTVTTSVAASSGSAHHTIPAPRLDLIAPAAAAPGASVTLTGAKFSWVTLVRFGGLRAAFTIVSDTSITATVPTNAVTGPVTVVSGGGVVSSLGDFVVLRPQPPQAPVLTLSASRRTLARGARVKLAGKLTPSDAAQAVRVTVQRRAAGSWQSAAGSSRTLGATGAYSWSYTPRRAGAYRARATAAGVASGWIGFRVR